MGDEQDKGRTTKRVHGFSLSARRPISGAFVPLKHCDG